MLLMSVGSTLTPPTVMLAAAGVVPNEKVKRLSTIRGTHGDMTSTMLGVHRRNRVQSHCAPKIANRRRCQDYWLSEHTSSTFVHMTKKTIHYHICSINLPHAGQEPQLP